jgi:DNA invertase Pin-like site-specific DNA recombinase
MDRSQQPARLRATIAAQKAAGMPWGRRPTTTHDEAIAARLAAGESMRAVTRALGCSFPLVKRVRDRLAPDREA